MPYQSKYPIRLDQIVPGIVEQKKRMAFAVGKKPRFKKPPKAISIKSQQRRYLKAMRPLINALKNATAEGIIPYLSNIIQNSNIPRKKDALDHRFDDYDDDIDGIIAESQIRFYREYPPEFAENSVGNVADDIVAFNAKEFDRQFKSVLGIDLAKIEPWLPTEIKSFVRENVGYWASVSDTYFQKLEGTILRGVRSGKLTDDISADIQDLLGVTESRAAFIARDQVAKFNGGLTQLRQTSVGVTKYIWSTSLDERVRPEHADREGEVFSWDDPPEDGHPGFAPNCRCSALPIVDEESQT